MDVRDIPCTVAPGQLATLLTRNQVARFIETGCLVGRARHDDGYIGIGANDQIDLLIGADTPLAEASRLILDWAQAWAEERGVSLATTACA